MKGRNTVQRQLVYRAVQDLNCHPTADEVYDIVVAAHPSISKGTVYRNLSKLAEGGMLRRIPIPNSADRYDTILTAHYHIFCKRCGALRDLDYPYLLSINREVERDTGYQLDEHDIVFTGLCPTCNVATRLAKDVDNIIMTKGESL